ncbi:MAG: amidohydrolase family protein [Chloroflexota bacterium]
MPHPERIVDFHTHILPDEFREERDRFTGADATFRSLFYDPGSRTASAEDLIAEMDASGVTTSVALGYGWTHPDAARLSNDYLLNAARRYPGRIVPFCSVNPAWGRAAIKEAERCVSLGARGIGELHPDSQGFTVEDQAAMGALAGFAAEAAIAVLAHGSEPVGHDYPGKGRTTPDKLLALAEAFPLTRFVFAHWGGGLPFFALMPEVRKALENVWFDSAATPYLYDPAVFSVVSAALGTERMLFGSDFPLLDQSRVLDDARGSGLDQGSLARVFAGNAAAHLPIQAGGG